VSSRRLRGGHTQQDPVEGGVLAARLCEGRRASRTREEFQVQMRVISKADLVRLTVSKVNAYSGGVLARALPEGLRYLST
jgi:hypothetical protein